MAEESKGGWKERPLFLRWAWAPELLPACWARRRLPLPTRKPAGPQASCLGFTLLLFLLWVSKAASQDSQGQRKHMPLSGQTHLPLNSPLQSEVSTVALQRPKKIGKQLYCHSFPMSPGLLGLDDETRDTNLGHLKDVILWLPVGAGDGGWPPHVPGQKEHCIPQGLLT